MAFDLLVLGVGEFELPQRETEHPSGPAARAAAHAGPAGAHHAASHHALTPSAALDGRVLASALSVAGG